MLHFVLSQPKTAHFCVLRAIFFNFTQSEAYLSAFSAQKAQILQRALREFFIFASYEIYLSATFRHHKIQVLAPPLIVIELFQREW